MKENAQEKTSKVANVKKKIVKKLFYKDEQRRLAKLVSGFSFDMFIMSVILADAIVLGLMTSDSINLYFHNILFLLDRLFMAIFIVEMFLKIYALKKKFFESGWNIFDLVIVAVSSVPAASAFIVLRTFRLFRLFKYVNRFSRLHNLVQVFIELLPTFLSFLAVSAIFSYAFAIIAVSLFGDVFAAFANVGSAMFTLLQALTLDGWASTIARPVMLVFPHAWVYFVSLIVLGFLIVVSFVVSAIRQIMDMKN